MFKSRFGYHPCTYETCQQLKETQLLLARAYREQKRLNRWLAKLPHNRRGPEPIAPAVALDGTYTFEGCTHRNLYHHTLALYSYARRPHTDEAAVSQTWVVPRELEPLLVRLREAYAVTV